MVKSWDLVETITISWAWSSYSIPFLRDTVIMIQRDAESLDYRILIDGNAIFETNQNAKRILNSILEYYTEITSELSAKIFVIIKNDKDKGAVINNISNFSIIKTTKHFITLGLNV